MLREYCTLYSSPKTVNETRPWDYRQCNIPLVQNFPIKSLKKKLLQATLYTSTHLGFAYRYWECGHEVYEMYYEALLANKMEALAKLYNWLGHPELITEGTKIKDSTIKYTSPDLRSAISNFDAVRDWLQVNAPCYVTHLESTGREVLPPCAEQFNLTEHTGEGEALSVLKPVMEIIESLSPREKEETDSSLNQQASLNPKSDLPTKYDTPSVEAKPDKKATEMAQTRSKQLKNKDKGRSKHDPAFQLLRKKGGKKRK
uniref:Uncharacterized protein n=1 Tax=Octactis speculum TaxID=3111310 RepID=A0A7S2GIY2_9STRA